MLFTVDEVAAIFRVTPRTVRQWTTDGVIDRIRIGGTVRYRRADVEALVTHGRAHNDHEVPAKHLVEKAQDRGLLRTS